MIVYPLSKKKIAFNSYPWYQYNSRHNGTGSTKYNKWNLSCYSLQVQAFLFGSRWFVRGGGGSTAAAVTLDTVADESRKKMADGVARSPSRLCSRDGKICCYGDAMSTIFLLASFFGSLLPTFRFSFFFSYFCYFFPPSRYVYLLGVPSSVQPSATLSKNVFCSTCSFCLCHLYHTPSRNSCVFYSFRFFFRSSYFSGGVF